MIEGMAGAGATDDNQAAGPHLGGLAQSIECVVDCLAERLAIRSGEPARAPETRDKQLAVAQQFDAALFAEVRELAAPDPDSGNSCISISGHVVQQRPAVRGHFIYRGSGHSEPS